MAEKNIRIGVATVGLVDSGETVLRIVSNVPTLAAEGGRGASYAFDSGSLRIEGVPRMERRIRVAVGDSGDGEPEASAICSCYRRGVYGLEEPMSCGRQAVADGDVISLPSRFRDGCPDGGRVFRVTFRRPRG